MAIDLRGHGDSDWAPTGSYPIGDYAQDLRVLVRSMCAPPILVGASLGGVASLLAAGEPPGVMISGLCMVDVSPHMDDAGVAGVFGFMKSAANGFATLEDAAEAVAAYLPHRKRPADAAALKKNLRRRDDGRLYWHWDPRVIQDQSGRVEIDERMESAAAHVDVPALLLRGEHSELVTQVSARRFMQRFADGRVSVIAGAHHMVAGDRNDLFSTALVDFSRTIRAAQSAAGEPTSSP